MLKIITKKLKRQHRFFNHLHNFSMNVRIFHSKELYCHQLSARHIWNISASKLVPANNEFYNSNSTISFFFEVAMRIASVIGTVVATIKQEKLSGRKLLLVREVNTAGKASGEPFVAIDTVDAGKGDVVVITEGSSARQTTFTDGLPIDAVIVAVIDSLEVEGKVTYRKQ
jgi:microcompartment protein CcmK/EutM